MTAILLLPLSADTDWLENLNLECLVSATGYERGEVLLLFEGLADCVWPRLALDPLVVIDAYDATEDGPAGLLVEDRPNLAEDVLALAEQLACPVTGFRVVAIDLPAKQTAGVQAALLGLSSVSALPDVRRV
jgi:hypothetical protein